VRIVGVRRALGTRASLSSLGLARCYIRKGARRGSNVVFYYQCPISGESFRTAAGDLVSKGPLHRHRDRLALRLHGSWDDEFGSGFNPGRLPLEYSSSGPSWQYELPWHVSWRWPLWSSRKQYQIILPRPGKPFDLLALGDERKYGAVEFVGRFPPNGMSDFRHRYKLSALDAIRDPPHEGRRRI